MVTPISNILKWTAYFWEHKLKPERPEIIEHFYKVDEKINEKVSIWQGDITKVASDCIVNAANESLLGGGGVDGAIHRAAGPKLVQECAKLNGCKIGEAKITSGYNLPSKHVIHTVGTMTKDPLELAKSYKNCLELMLKHSLKSIVFPCISTGIYGYPVEEAAHVALYEARSFLQENKEKVKRIVFCLFSEEDVKIYEELMQRYFPVITVEGATKEDVEKMLAEMSPNEREENERILKGKAAPKLIHVFGASVSEQSDIGQGKI